MSQSQPDIQPTNAATRLRRVKVATSESYIYDPAKVQALYDELQPDPDEYGDDPVMALLAYIGTDSPYSATVFDAVGDLDHWLMEDDDADEKHADAYDAGFTDGSQALKGGKAHV